MIESRGPMKEVDPDVAALLDDLPRTRLPPELVREGWGQYTMRESGYKPRRPSPEQQPVYDQACARCGRPITDRNGFWRDHAGRKNCSGDLLDDPGHGYHCTKEEQDYLDQQWKLLSPKVEPPYLARLTYPLTTKPPPTTFCQAEHTQGAHTHVCQHPSDHFGMHECSDQACHHLWH